MDLGATLPEDLPSIPGVRLDIYAAKPELPFLVEWRLFEEVKAAIYAMRAFSERTGAVFEVVLAGDDVGVIENGEVSDGLELDLLGGWEKVLDERLQAEQT